MTRRLRECVERWPEAAEGEYDPHCCRFPKSCSATVYDEARVTDADLEPKPTPTAPRRVHARDLPEGSVVAGGRRVFVKRSNARSQPIGSPFYQEWWIEADTYAIGVDNGWINQSLVSGRLVVLREGWGSNDE